MGVVYELLCLDCKKNFDLGKYYFAEYLTYIVLRDHAGHKVIFSDDMHESWTKHLSDDEYEALEEVELK